MSALTATERLYSSSDPDLWPALEHMQWNHDAPGSNVFSLLVSLSGNHLMTNDLMSEADKSTCCVRLQPRHPVTIDQALHFHSQTWAKVCFLPWCFYLFIKANLFDPPPSSFTAGCFQLNAWKCSKFSTSECNWNTPKETLPLLYTQTLNPPLVLPALCRPP